MTFSCTIGSPKQDPARILYAQEKKVTIPGVTYYFFKNDSSFNGEAQEEPSRTCAIEPKS